MRAREVSLGTLLKEADIAYQDGLPSPLSDAQFDELARRCGYESMVTPELLSLQNAIDPDELQQWLNDRGNPVVWCEVKCDGVAALVTYEDDTATAIRTRRQERSAAIAHLPHLPGFTGRVKGELWSERGRPWAAGRIRANDTAAGVRFMLHCADASEHASAPEQHRSPWSATLHGAAQIIEAWDAWRNGELPLGSMPTDGLVISVADPSARAELGSSKRVPLFALALKGGQARP
ncbi:MAG: hypothetical protein WBN89_00595 [Prochlorococcaceae cyanobacterium]